MKRTDPRRSIPLPAAVRARFEKQLNDSRRTWDETGDPLAVAEAITWVYLHRQLIPPWLEEAAIRSLVRERTELQTRRHREAMQHWWRWRLVRDGKLANLSWAKAYERAARMLTDGGKPVDEETVKKSYARVQRDIDAKRFGKYWILKDKRYRHLFK